MNGKKLAILAVAFAGTLGVGLAEARGRDDVQWSVTIGQTSPGWIGQPVHVYEAPVRAYHPAPVWAGPAHVYDAPVRAYHPGYHHGYHPGYHRSYGSRHWDADRDGIPNRYDRVYNPRWDRDGDGIPNRYDRVHNPRWDRDGDGIPNRYDRYDNRRHGGWDGYHRGH